MGLIAIGDIHGCANTLDVLLDRVAPAEDDHLIFVGDYIDRGPDSKGVLDTLIDLGSRTQLVGILGNHEEMMLDVLHHGVAHHSWLQYGGVETLDSYGFRGDLDFLPPAHQDFLDCLGDYYISGDYFFTHAAYNPDLPLDEQEIEMLRWHSLNAGIPAKHVSGRTAIVGHASFV